MADIGSFLGGFAGGSIGGAVVQLFLDKDQFDRSLTTSQAQLKSSTTSMAQTTKGFGQYAAVAWAAAGTAVLAFAADSIAAAVDHENAMATLRNAVGENTEAYEAQATALQSLTGVQDEEILRADAVISRFNLTSAEVQRAIPIILDFAKANGQDVVTAAGSVGKALLGNTRALKAVGINYEVTGKATQDFNGIMAALQEKVGGASTDLGETEKRAIAFRVAIEELKEGVGALILQAVGPLLDDLADLTQAFSSLTSSINGGGGGTGLMDAWTWLEEHINPVRALLHGAGDALRDVDEAVGGLTVTATASEGFLEDYQKQMKAIGVETEKSGRRIAHFAGMTGADLHDWRDGIKEDFEVANESASGFKAKFQTTVRQFARGLENMRTRLREQLQDLREFNELKMGENIRKFFLEQGPDAIHAFVTANKDQREEFKENASAILTNQHGVNDAIEAGTGKLDKFKDKLSDTNGRKARVDVEVHYGWSGTDPFSLPGLGGGYNQGSTGKGRARVDG